MDACIKIKSPLAIWEIDQPFLILIQANAHQVKPFSMFDFLSDSVRVCIIDLAVAHDFSLSSEAVPQSYDAVFQGCDLLTDLARKTSKPVCEPCRWFIPISEPTLPRSFDQLHCPANCAIARNHAPQDRRNQISINSSCHSVRYDSTILSTGAGTFETGGTNFEKCMWNNWSEWTQLFFCIVHWDVRKRR